MHTRMPSRYRKQGTSEQSSSHANGNSFAFTAQSEHQGKVFSSHTLLSSTLKLSDIVSDGSLEQAQPLNCAHVLNEVP